MFWWLQNLKYASQNNSNGEEKKKTIISLNWLENFKNIFLIFRRNQRLQKTIKI